MEDVEGCLWCRGLYVAKGKDVAIFRTKKCIKVRWVRMLDMQVTLHDKRIVMQIRLHDKRIVMQITLHYEVIVMQVTLHDKRIVMQVTLHYEAIVMHVTLHNEIIVMQVTLHYEFKAKISPRKSGITSYGYWLWIVFSGWSSVSTGASFTKGAVSSIPIGCNISLEGFLLPILLLVVIIVMVVTVVVILIVVVAIIGVIVVVGGVFIIKLSFVIVGFEAVTFPSMLLGVSLGSRFLLVSLVLIACVSRAATMPSVISRWMVARVMAGVSDVDVLLGGILST
nr:hypothetical protein [Tanacetum cinerariifolium]